MIDTMHMLDKLYVESIKLKRVHNDQHAKLVEFDNIDVRLKKNSYYYKSNNIRGLKDFLFELQNKLKN